MSWLLCVTTQVQHQVSDGLSSDGLKIYMSIAAISSFGSQVTFAKGEMQRLGLEDCL